MQGRITFHCLRRAIEATLVCPSSRDAIEHIARLVPSGTGPKADLLDCVLFVNEQLWRFRSPYDAKRFAELLESYFRNFNPHYRIRTLEQPAEAAAGVRFL